MIRTYRYVPHHRVHDFLVLGWVVACTDLGHHSYYAVLMEWLCGCKRVEPT